MADAYPQATETIARGDFEKVVLARATDTPVYTAG